MAITNSSTQCRVLQSADEFALLTELDGKVGTILGFHNACLAIMDAGSRTDWRQQLEALQAVMTASRNMLKNIDEAMPQLLDIYQARLKAASMQMEVQP